MQFFDRLAELERTHATFAVATVVGRRSPVSSHLGDRAVIYADGRMEGFVGGSCSRDIVRRHGLVAIGRGKPCLLHIRPELQVQDETRDAGDGENIFVPMACASEGAVDVYIEPHVPLRSLIVVGFTPVADALARIAGSLDYKVVRVLDDEELRDAQRPDGAAQLSLDALPRYLASLEPLEASRIVAVVASQGHYDESALEALLGVEVAFVGLLASRKRAASVFGVLAQGGATADKLARIRNPVGLDIGACNPAEVAVSILAEIIAETPPMTARAEGLASVLGSAVDPVCGMTVDPATARYRMEFASQAYVFCGAGCRATFAAQPQQYPAAAHTS